MKGILQSDWFSFPKAFLLCLGIAAVLCLPGLWTGFFIDDYFHLAILEGEDFPADPLNLFRFGPGDPEEIRPFIERGPYPWWTLPEFKANFFRPLTCVLAVTEHRLFGRQAFFHHVHSLLWYLALIVGIGCLFRRALPHSVAVLALLLFTVDEVHWFPAIWIANRNALVAGVPALWALVAHIRWREDGWTPGLPLSLLGMAAGLAGGESAFGVLCYLGAYELFGERENLLRRLSSLAPAGILTASYLVFYKLLGYGTHGSGLYIEPMGEPLTYLSHAPGRILALIAAQLLGVTADSWAFFPKLRPFQILIGAFTLLLFGGLLRIFWREFQPKERRALRWFLPGALLAFFPPAATFPTNRLLLHPSIGGSVLLAVLLAHWWQRRALSERFLKTSFLCWVLVVLHLLIPPVFWWGQSLLFKTVLAKVNKGYIGAEFKDEEVPKQKVLLLMSPEPLSCVYPPIVWELAGGRPKPESWHTLSGAPYDHQLSRPSENVLIMEVLDGTMLQTDFELLMRAPQYPFHEGDQVFLDQLAVRILETKDGKPKKVAFTFEKPLDDPTLCFLEWSNGKLRRAKLPRVGETISLKKQVPFS